MYELNRCSEPDSRVTKQGSSQKVQWKVEYGEIKALVTKSSEPTHTKGKRLVSKRVSTEAMVDAVIMRQKSEAVLTLQRMELQWESVVSMDQGGLWDGKPWPAM